MTAWLAGGPELRIDARDGALRVHTSWGLAGGGRLLREDPDGSLWLCTQRGRRAIAFATTGERAGVFSADPLALYHRSTRRVAVPVRAVAAVVRGVTRVWRAIRRR